MDNKAQKIISFLEEKAERKCFHFYNKKEFSFEVFSKELDYAYEWVVSSDDVLNIHDDIWNITYSYDGDIIELTESEIEKIETWLYNFVKANNN